MAKEIVIHGYQSFVQTKYIGQTNQKPSRVKAWCVSNPKRNVTLSWDHSTDFMGNSLKAATALYEALANDGTTYPEKVAVTGVEGGGYIFTRHE